MSYNIILTKPNNEIINYTINELQDLKQILEEYIDKKIELEIHKVKIIDNKKI